MPARYWNTIFGFVVYKIWSRLCGACCLQNKSGGASRCQCVSTRFRFARQKVSNCVARWKNRNGQYVPYLSSLITHYRDEPIHCTSVYCVVCSGCWKCISKFWTLTSFLGTMTWNWKIGHWAIGKIKLYYVTKFYVDRSRNKKEKIHWLVMTLRNQIKLIQSQRWIRPQSYGDRPALASGLTVARPTDFYQLTGRAPWLASQAKGLKCSKKKK